MADKFKTFFDFTVKHVPAVTPVTHAATPVTHATTPVTHATTPVEPATPVEPVKVQTEVASNNRQQTATKFKSSKPKTH